MRPARDFFRRRRAVVDGLTAKELRLRSTEEPNFRSALAECLTCWVFAGLLRYQVTPREGGGRPGKQLEFAVATPHETLSVEVKAPAADLPDGTVRIWAGDDSHILEKAVRDAASQFGHGTKNLLVIVPTLRTSVWTQRSQLVKALIGEPVVHIYVPLDDDRASYSEPGFAPRGRLVRPGKKGLHGEPLPAHTRVSAVMVIEVVQAERAEREPPVGEDFGRQLEAWVERRYSADNAFWPEYRITVVHIPNAECPLAPETLARFPQLLKAPEGAMTWSDREPTTPAT